MKVSIPNLLQKWSELVENAEKILSLAGVSYLVIWRNAPASKGWNDVLLMIRLLFTVAVSNPRLESIFPRLKCVKSNFRCSFGIKWLENILRIMEVGSSWETYDPISVVKKWGIDKVRRTTEEKQSSSYKSHNFAIKWISVMMTVAMSKKVFLEMETKKDICFLLVPSKLIIIFFVS